MLEIELAAKRSAQKRQSALKAIAILGFFAAAVVLLSVAAPKLFVEEKDDDFLDTSIEVNGKLEQNYSSLEYPGGLGVDVSVSAQSEPISGQEFLELNKDQIIKELEFLAEIPTLAPIAFDLLDKLEIGTVPGDLPADVMATLRELRADAETERRAIETKAMLAISTYDAERAVQLVRSLRKLESAQVEPNEQSEASSLVGLGKVLDSLEVAESSGNISSIKAATAALEGIVPEFASKIRRLEEELVGKGVQKRIEKVQQMLADAISDQDFPAAERTLSQLKLLGGSGESIRTFRRLLDDSRDATHAARSLVKAEISYSLGDLSAAVSTAREAVEIDPSSTKARKALSLYQSEMALMSRAKVFLDQPHRLASDNVMTDATALLAELGPFESPVLSDLSVELRQLISDYSKTFILAVTSDDVSRIELVGVGFIEPTLERRVTLSRGTYTLVARCKGHRDQVVDIDQDFEFRPETTIEVSIGCGPKLN